LSKLITDKAVRDTFPYVKMALRLYLVFTASNQGRRNSCRAGGQYKCWGQWKLIKKSLPICLFPNVRCALAFCIAST